MIETLREYKYYRTMNICMDFAKKQAHDMQWPIPQCHPGSAPIALRVFWTKLTTKDWDKE